MVHNWRDEGGNLIAGTKIQTGQRGRVLCFDKGLGEAEFSDLLAALMRDKTEFSLHDPSYPSPSDPGAYMSYSPHEGNWRMTLGNHGWSGGIYDIRPATLSRQIYSLYASGRLSSLGLDRVGFLGHYRPASAEANDEMNLRLLELHA